MRGPTLLISLGKKPFRLAVSLQGLGKITTVLWANHYKALVQITTIAPFISLREGPVTDRLIH